MNEETYNPSNREKAQRARRVRYWCMSCDSQLVDPGRKCPVCGKNKSRKVKRKDWHKE